jgi:hypothetical protein
MGAQFNFDKLNATTPKLAEVEGHELIARAAYDHGHSGYSGSFAECDGVVVDTTKFKDEASAKAYLNDNALKWGPMIIVKAGKSFYAGAWCSS